MKQMRPSDGRKLVLQLDAKMSSDNTGLVIHTDIAYCIKRRRDSFKIFIVIL